MDPGADRDAGEQPERLYWGSGEKIEWGGWIDGGGALAEADYGAVRLHNVNMDAGGNHNVGKESQVSTTVRLLITWHH